MTSKSREGGEEVSSPSPRRFQPSQFSEFPLPAMDRTQDFTSLEHLPPRHDIESDSEDDSPGRSRLSPSSTVSIFVDAFSGQEDSPLLVVVGKEAKRLVDGLEALHEKEVGRVLEGGKNVVSPRRGGLRRETPKS